MSSNLGELVDEPKANRTSSTWQRSLSLLTGLLLGFGWFSSPERFVQAYVATFALLVTLGQGALFFVLTHYLVGARWSSRACQRMLRISELLRWAPLLFLPLAVKAPDLYPWLRATTEDLAHHPSMASFWTWPLFLARSIAYLSIWFGLVWWLRWNATRGTSSDLDRLRRWSGPAMIVFGLTSVFSAFDWWMGLERGLHSSIYGIYVFSGSVPASLALLAVINFVTDVRQPNDASAVAERHDIGKLLFGFVMFWAYIALCQYLIVWYANLSNEMAYYHLRWARPWRIVTTAVVMLRFVAPFIVLLSRSTKRSRADLAAVATLVLAGHALDVIWLVMPPLAPQGRALGLPECAAAMLALTVTVGFARSAVSAPTGPIAEMGHQPLIEPLRTYPSPHGSAIEPHFLVLPTPRATIAPHAKKHLSRLPWLAVGTASLAMVGGMLLAFDSEVELRRDAARKQEAAMARAVRSHPRSNLDEYRWLDKANDVLQVPVDVARARVQAEYSANSDKKATKVATDEPKPAVYSERNP